jgi:hypothetical protein
MTDYKAASSGIISAGNGAEVGIIGLLPLLDPRAFSYRKRVLARPSSCHCALGHTMLVEARSYSGYKILKSITDALLYASQKNKPYLFWWGPL